MKRVSPLRGAAIQQTGFTLVFREQGKEKGMWWISAMRTVPGDAVLKPSRAVKCSYLHAIHAVNTLLQMRCSQGQWFSQKLKWDLRPRKQSFKSQSQAPACPWWAPAAGGKWETEPPLPPPFCQVSPVLSSPFSSSLHPRVSLVETLHPSHPSSSCLPFPLLQLTHSY